MTGDTPPRRLDGVAVTASVLRLIQCPVLLAILMALPAGVLAMMHGYRRHGLRWPLVATEIGRTPLGTGAFAIDPATMACAITSLGAVLPAVSHVGNWRALSHRAPARPVCPMGEQA